MSNEGLKEFCLNELYPSALVRDDKNDFDRKLWKKLANTGFFYSLSNLTTLVERFSILGEFSLDIPFAVSAVAHFIGIDLLQQFGNSEQKSRYLQSGLDGEAIFAIANSEETCGTDVLNIKSKIFLKNGVRQCSVYKNCATNLGDADAIFCSAWDISSARRPFMEMLILDKSKVNQTLISESLAGFYTGLTGSIQVDQCAIDTSAVLGNGRQGFRYLGHCYNLERLAIGAIMVGILNYARKIAMHLISNKSSMNNPLVSYQYVQNKIIQISQAYCYLNGLISTILSDLTDSNVKTLDLKHSGKELALLKIAVIEQGEMAIKNLFELSGANAYGKSNRIQKLLRDHLALTFLGGSIEQQKMTFIDCIMKEYKKYDVPPPQQA